MPLLLVTGISGFIATHVALRFLEEGWLVRGTVRSQSKAQTVSSLPCFQKFYAEGKLSFSVIEDIATADYTEALKDVSAVAHVAAAVSMHYETWESYRGPAVLGTRRIVEACKRTPTVKNFVFTSSFAAIADFSRPANEQKGKNYTELDYSPVTEDVCVSLTPGPDNGGIWYCGAKVQGELEGFRCAEGADFTCACINPPMVYGPVLHPVHDIDELNFSVAEMYSLIKEGAANGVVPPTTFPVFADVRDVADAHFRAVDQGLQGRYVISSGEYDFHEVADMVRKCFPELATRLPKPSPEGSQKGKVYTLDSSKALRDMGIQFRPLETTVRDTFQQFIEIEKRLA